MIALEIPAHILSRIEAALAPCVVTYEYQSFGRRLGVAWEHPSGGMHAVVFGATTASEDIAQFVERSRHELTTRAQWANVRAPRWRFLLLFMPKRRAALEAKRIALIDAITADELNRSPPVVESGEEKQT